MSSPINAALRNTTSKRLHRSLRPTDPPQGHITTIKDFKVVPFSFVPTIVLLATISGPHIITSLTWQGGSKGDAAHQLDMLRSNNPFTDQESAHADTFLSGQSPGAPGLSYTPFMQSVPLDIWVPGPLTYYKSWMQQREDIGITMYIDITLRHYG